MSNFTESPTLSPTPFVTESPTPLFITKSPTLSPTPLFTVNMTEKRINVIHLPDYTSHDTVDGLFLGLGTFLLIILLVLCLQRINSNRITTVNRSY